MPDHDQQWDPAPLRRRRRLRAPTGAARRRPARPPARRTDPRPRLRRRLAHRRRRRARRDRRGRRRLPGDGRRRPRSGASTPASPTARRSASTPSSTRCSPTPPCTGCPTRTRSWPAWPGPCGPAAASSPRWAAGATWRRSGWPSTPPAPPVASHRSCRGATPPPTSCASRLERFGFEPVTVEHFARLTPITGTLATWMDLFGERLLADVDPGPAGGARRATPRSGPGPGSPRPTGVWVVDYVRLRFSARRR